MKKEIKRLIKEINSMSQIELAIMQQIAPEEHAIFKEAEIYSVLQQRFKKLGGMTSEIARQVGLE